MRNRTEEIKAKGFNLMQGSVNTDYREGQTGYQGAPIDFSKIKVGAKTLEDANFELGSYKQIKPRLADKQTILKAIDSYDLKTMREVSDFYYKTSGIYNRILRYMAYMYNYDWYVTPYINDESYKKEKALAGFNKCLNRLENFGVKKTLGEIALKVLRNGAYYCYRIVQNDKVVLQELPVNYCRSRFSIEGRPVVEFNMKFFDEYFRSTEEKLKILKVFPAEFSKGYVLYKQGKLPAEAPGDDGGWYTLDVYSTERFTANGEEYPMFISVIPLILDLDEAQGLDRKKMLQRLLKIVIQKMPLDKNGELIFDVEEAQQLHNSAVQMLGRAIGVDVLTTFADVEVASISDTTAASAQTDDLERVERQLYNEAGVSQKQFNTDSNIALEKSILNDAATLYNLILQFEDFLNHIIEDYNKTPNKICYKVQILKTTIYNYQDLAKLYKEQVALGYSKMLPQVALGQTQSSILANAYFENEILDLVNVFIPPLQSSTMNENILNRKAGSATPAGDNKVGRKELDNDKKSEKTIANRESMN